MYVFFFAEFASFLELDIRLCYAAVGVKSRSFAFAPCANVDM